MSKRTIVQVDDDGIRPAGKPDECFYCKQKIGTQHKSDCVMLTQRGKVRLNLEVIGWLPCTGAKEAKYCLDWKDYGLVQFLRSVADLIEDGEMSYECKSKIIRLYPGMRRKEDVFVIEK